MGKSLRAQPFDDSILGIGIKIGIDGGSRLVLISHSMSAPVSASTTHKKISASSSKKWVPSQACNICLINCLMLFSTSRMTVHQKLMDNFHFAFGIGRPKNIQHNPPGPSVDMENICSTNLMWEVRSIFLEYQVSPLIKRSYKVSASLYFWLPPLDTPQTSRMILALPHPLALSSSTRSARRSSASSACISF